MAQRTAAPATTPATTSPDLPAGAKRRAPSIASRETGANHPFVEVSPPYQLAFHPDRWVVMAGRLIPSLSRVAFIAGVNHVEQSKDGSFRTARTRGELEDRGYRLIPYEWAPDGESYLYSFDTRPNGSREPRETWATVWETATSGARETSPDEDGYAEWCVSLVDSGRLPVCALDVARRMLERARGRLEKTLADAAKTNGHGGNRIRANAIQREVEVLTEYVDAQTEAKAATRKRRAPVVTDAESPA